MNQRQDLGEAGGPGGTVAPDVITPDAVGLELPVATVGSRGVSWLLDALILLAGLLLVGVMTAVLGGGGFVEGWLAIALLLLLVFGWQFGYPIGFEVGLRGRTPGKMAMGLRVVTVEGAPVGFRHAVIRALVGLFELPMLLGAPAVVSSLASRRGQRLGDLAAGTMVVRERRVGGVPHATVFVPPPGLEDYAARLDTTSVDPSTYALVRDTLRRAPRLPPATRARITAELATRVLARVTPPPPAGVPAEPWLWCVAASVQRRRRATVAGTAGAGGAWGTPPGQVPAPHPPRQQPAGPQPAGPLPPPGGGPSGAAPRPRRAAPTPGAGASDPAGGPTAPPHRPVDARPRRSEDDRDTGFAPPT